MTASTWFAVGCAALGACFLLALASYSLRDFSRSRLEEICQRKGREDRFSAILKHYEDAMLACDLLQTVMLIVLAAAVFEWLDLRGSELERDQRFAVGFESVGIAMSVWGMAVMLPWCIARVAGEPFLYRVWPALAATQILLKPALLVARQLDTYAHRLTGMDEPGEPDASSLTEEIRTVVDEGQREGLIEKEAGTMIQRVIELQQADVSSIMTPRTDMITIPLTATLEFARQQFLECGHSRIPVVGESTDDIVGILYAKDLLKHLREGAPPPPDLQDLVREPIYIPETAGIDTLLQTMKRDRVHFAIVIDEYGGVAGLVTMEDILEEIVGEIGDEYDAAEETGIFPGAPGTVEVASWVRIDELNEKFEYDLPEDDDYATIGGFVFSQLGRIPKAGDSFQWQQLRVSVLSADKRKIDRLRIDVDRSVDVEAGREE